MIDPLVDLTTCFLVAVWLASVLSGSLAARLVLVWKYFSDWEPW